MFTSLTEDLFHRHRAFHHYFQHFLVAGIGYTLSHFLFTIPLTLSSLLLFLITSYAIDFDGFIAIFRMKKQIPELDQIISALKQRHFKHAMVLSVIYHKKMNRLLLHNIIGFAGISLFLVFSSHFRFQTGVIIFSAIITHFIFDILDDIYQLHHINNWLWPLEPHPHRIIYRE